jgi:hypothetical protein
MKKIMFSYSYNDNDAKLFIDSFKKEMSILDLELISFDNLPIAVSMDEYFTETINLCDFFVCFISQNNANVMLELGYALGIRKNIIIIGEHNNIPFALQAMNFFPRSIKSYELLSYLGEYISRNDNLSRNDHIDIKSLSVNNLITNPEIINQLSVFDFENIIVKWFKQKGYEIECNNNVGYDLKILSFDGNVTLVEIKKYSENSSVSISTVQQLVSSMCLENVNTGIIISSSQFTKAAISFASSVSSQILLWTLDDLITLTEYKI